MSNDSNDTAPRSFVRFLADLGDGHTARDLSEDLHEMEKKLHDLAIATGAKAKGELKLSLKFSTDALGVCTVTPEVKLTLPKKPTTAGIMWHNPKTGHLSASNPRQLELGKLREVPRARFVESDDDDESSGSRH